MTTEKDDGPFSPDERRQLRKITPHVDALKEIAVRDGHMEWAARRLRLVLTYLAGIILALGTVWGAFRDVIKAALGGDN